MPHQFKDPRWSMQWITLITFIIIIPISLIAGVVLAYQTKSPVPLAISGPPLLAIRPIIRYLFPHRGK